MVVDEKGVFKEHNFSKAIEILENELNLDKILEEKKQKKKQSKVTQSSEIKKIIQLIMSKGLDPCIVFSFSKRECEAFALALKGLDFNIESEKE